MSLFMIAVKSLLKRTKRFILQIAIFSVSMVLIQIAFMTLGEIIENRWEIAANTYGEHHGTFYSLSDEQYQKLLSFAQQDADIGTAVVLEEVHNDKVAKPIYVGYCDEAFRRIGHIQPLNSAASLGEDGVWIEESLAVKLGNLREGSVFRVTSARGMQEYRVSGILYNYTSLWQRSLNGSAADSVLPNILITKPGAVLKNADGQNVKRHAIVQYRGEDSAKGIERFYNLANSLGILNYAVNAKMHIDTAKQEIDLLQYVRFVFAACIILATTLLVCNLIQTDQSTVREQMTAFRCMGGSRRTCLAFYLCQQVISISLATFLGVAGASLYLRLMNIRPLDATCILILALFIAIISLASIVNVLRFVNGKAPIKGELKQRGGISHHLYPSLALAKHYMVKNIRYFLPSILSLLICIILFSVGMELRGFFSQDLSHVGLDYELIVPEEAKSRYVGDYEMEYNANNALSWDDYREVKALQGVRSLIAEPRKIGTVITFTQVDRYFALWEAQNEELWDEKNNYGVSFPEEHIINSVEFVVLDDEYMKMLLQQHQMGIGVPGNCEVLLFLPDTGRQSDLKPGEKIAFARVDFLGDENGKVNAEYIRFEFTIAGIQHGAYRFDISGTLQKKDVPTIVMTQDAARTSGIFPGYRRFAVTVDKSARQEKISDNLKQIAGQYPFAYYFSKAEYQERNMVLADVLSALITALCVVLGGYSIISAALVFAARMLSRKTDYGVYLAFGARKHAVVLSLFLENIAYSAMSIFGGCMILILLLVFSGLSLNSLRHYALYLALISSGILIASNAILFAATRQLQTKSIGELISYKE